MLLSSARSFLEIKLAFETCGPGSYEELEDALVDNKTILKAGKTLYSIFKQRATFPLQNMSEPADDLHGQDRTHLKPTFYNTRDFLMVLKLNKGPLMNKFAYGLVTLKMMESLGYATHSNRNILELTELREINLLHIGGTTFFPS